MKRLFFLLALGTQVSFGQICLVTDSLYSFGNGPTTVAYADFSGDWINDMVVSYPNLNVLKVSVNNGSGIFQPPTTLTTGTTPTHAIAFDMNGDYSGDIVCTNSGSNNLTKFINNGLGTFTSSTMSLGYSPNAILNMDVDGDWDQDMIVSNAGNTQFTTYLNDGSGNFTLGTTSNAAFKVTSMAGLDIDWDGIGDLVTANASNAGANSVSYFKGNGGGAFQAAVNYATTVAFATDVLFADMDGDYYQDIVVSTFNYTIEILKNNGFGQFSPGYVYNSFPNRQHSISAGDFTGDYFTDIAFSDSSNGSVAVLINNGAGNLNVKAYPSPLTGGSSILDIQVGDMNGDYVTDIGAVMEGKNKICAILNYNVSIYYTFNSPVCQNDPPFLLDAYPQGGIFYVNGIQGNWFDPMVYGPGTHTVVYVYTPPSGCPITDTTSITVLPSNGQTIYNETNKFACVSSPPFLLTQGSPPGGTYSGAGVNGNSFDPAFAGMGQHIITYALGNCGGSDTSLISVVTSPVNVTLILNPPSTCVATPSFTLAGGNPAGGAYSGTGVSNGTFNPATAGVGNHLITYSFTDPNSGCTDYELASMYVSPCLVSIDELEAQTNLRVTWQNDNEQVIVSATKTIQNLEVYDINGKFISGAKVSATDHILPVHGIANGVYYVKVFYGDQSGQVKKFVKL